jgi:DNA repair exonuclease SbcCD nuclease subunit
VQAGYLAQLKSHAGDLQILCAGDIFDRWNPSPELINFALDHLPNGMICVPGQHDLPNHSMGLIHRSGYGVLLKAGKISDISDGEWFEKNEFVLHGFGWGQEIKPQPEDEKDCLTIALIHRYCWMAENRFPGALQSSHVVSYKKALQGYDFAIFGDNHKSFVADAGACKVVNCGGFIRRKSDEQDYQPSMWDLYSDGTVKRVKLDTSKDVFHKTLEEEESPINMREFIDKLEGLGEHGSDFRQIVKGHLQREDIHPKVKEIILRALHENVE